MIGRGTVSGKMLIDTVSKNLEKIRHAADGLPVSEFKPLRAWPAHQHPRQKEIDQIKSIPSLVR